LNRHISPFTLSDNDHNGEGVDDGAEYNNSSEDENTNSARQSGEFLQGKFMKKKQKKYLILACLKKKNSEKFRYFTENFNHRMSSHDLVYFV